MNIDQLKLIKYENFFNILPSFLFEMPYKNWIIPKTNDIELLYVLHYLLQNNLSDSFTSEKKLNNHIFNNMLHIIDPCPDNISFIKKISKIIQKI